MIIGNAVAEFATLRAPDVEGGNKFVRSHYASIAGFAVLDDVVR